MTDRIRLIDSGTGEVLLEALRSPTPLQQLIADEAASDPDAGSTRIVTDSAELGPDGFTWTTRAHVAEIDERWHCGKCGHVLAGDGSDGPFYAYGTSPDWLSAPWCRHCARR